MAPAITAAVTSGLVGIEPNPSSPLTASLQASRVVPSTMATTIHTSTPPMITVWNFSTVWYTTGEAVSVTRRRIRPRMPTSLMSRSPTTKERQVAAPVAKPGQTFGMNAIRTNRNHHGRQKRVKPVMAVSPVASVQRSTSMLMKNWMATATTAAHRTVSPMFAAM